MTMISAADKPAKSGVLILASSQHAAHPYAEWLADLAVPLLAIGDETAPPTSDFAQVSLASSWEPNDLVRQALALHTSFGFDRVIGLGEVDIIPAARIRESLGLVGQWEASAWVYRDKLRMREEAVATGIRVPRFAAADDAADVTAFIRDEGAPVMVKPRMGLGALGIRRIDELAGASDLFLPEGPGNYLVESFVDGPTFHVDALRIAGEIVLAVPCAYVGAGCISHWSDAGIGSYTLARQNPLAERLAAAAAQVAESFAGPPDLAIHAEFFLSDGDLFLCEVASRGGGGSIPLMLTRYLGADIRHLWARIQCGLPVDWKAIDRRLASVSLVAGFGLPPRDGQLLEVPSAAPPGVEGLQLRSSPGEDFAGARYAQRHSGDFVAAWTVTADDEAELLRRLDATAAEMERAIAWSVTASV
jgi:hypothetical protein